MPLENPKPNKPQKTKTQLIALPPWEVLVGNVLAVSAL